MVLLAAILLLAPHLPEQDTSRIARAIRAEVRKDIDPLLVAAVIHHETGGTWDRMLVSRTHDHGLLQVHVSKTTNADLLGREAALFNVRENIRRGVGLLRFWKRYHVRRCRDQRHRWWAHYKYGVRVRGHSYWLKIDAIYRRLRGES